eukprot:4587688-Amphidinium_carterae.1
MLALSVGDVHGIVKLTMQTAKLEKMMESRWFHPNEIEGRNAHHLRLLVWIVPSGIACSKLIRDRGEKDVGRVRQALQVC